MTREKLRQTLLDELGNFPRSREEILADVAGVGDDPELFSDVLSRLVADGQLETDEVPCGRGRAPILIYRRTPAVRGRRLPLDVKR